MRVLAVSLLLIAAPAFADDAAQAYLRATNMLYQKLEYEKALEQLQRAKKASSGLDDDVRISLWEGILLAELGRMEDARTAFNTALALSVEAKLPVKVSPKVTAEFEKLRVEAKKELARTEPPPPAVVTKPVEVAPPLTPPPEPVAELVAPPLIPAQPSRGVRRLAVIPFAIGGAGGVAAIVGLVGGATAADRLRSGRLTLVEAQQVRDSGSTFQLVGFVGLGVGVAGLLTGSLMALLGGPSAPAISLAPLPGGAAVGLRVQLP